MRGGRGRRKNAVVDDELEVLDELPKKNWSCRLEGTGVRSVSSSRR